MSQSFIILRIRHHFTVVTFLLNLGHVVNFPVLFENIYSFLFIMIEYTSVEYVKWKKLHFYVKNKQKRNFGKKSGLSRVWIGDLEIMNPACYQKSYHDWIKMSVLFCQIWTKVMNSKDFCTTNSQIKLPQKK